MDMGFSDSRNRVATALAPVPLRPLGWGELCARLLAAQSLLRKSPDGDFVPPTAPHVASARKPARAVVTATLGSFDARAAAMLARLGQSQGFINSTYSVNGKDNSGTSLVRRTLSAEPAQSPRQADEICHD